MSLRLLGGQFKGLELQVVESPKLRPTSVMLKRRFFDSLQNWQGLGLIDLCAGSGAIGLEALSRGASRVLLVEKDPKFYKVLERNTQHCQKRLSSTQQVQSFLMDVEVFLNKKIHLYLTQQPLQQWYIYLDPPYDKHQVYFNVLNSFFKLHLESPAVLWLESDRQKGISLSTLEASYELGKSFMQGTSFIAEVQRPRE